MAPPKEARGCGLRYAELLGGDPYREAADGLDRLRRNLPRLPPQLGPLRSGARHSELDALDKPGPLELGEGSKYMELELPSRCGGVNALAHGHEPHAKRLPSV